MSYYLLFYKKTGCSKYIGELWPQFFSRLWLSHFLLALQLILDSRNHLFIRKVVYYSMLLYLMKCKKNLCNLKKKLLFIFLIINVRKSLICSFLLTH